MIMKWSDIMPGDVVRVSENFKLENKDISYYGWEQRWWWNSLLHVVKVELTEQHNQLRISVKDAATSAFYETFSLDYDGMYNGLYFFELISIAGD